MPGGLKPYSHFSGSALLKDLAEIRETCAGVLERKLPPHDFSQLVDDTAMVLVLGDIPL